MPKPPEIVWNPRLSPGANARQRLPELAAAYFAEARTLLAEAEEPAKLHRLRLISKRLRYTLELFRPVYGPGLTEFLRSLKALQDILGDLNDAVVAGGLIAGIPSSTRMQRYLQNLTAGKAVAFRDEWHSRFDAPGREAYWITFLSGSGIRLPEPRTDAKGSGSVDPSIVPARRDAAG